MPYSRSRCLSCKTTIFHAGFRIIRTITGYYNEARAWQKDQGDLEQLYKNGKISIALYDHLSGANNNKLIVGPTVDTFQQFRAQVSIDPSRFRGPITDLAKRLYDRNAYISYAVEQKEDLYNALEEIRRRNSSAITSHTNEVITAQDPNIKYGPEGNVLPGQKLAYKVEYENEGEGIAFGVYFTDTLDRDLDDSTLVIGPVIDIQTGAQIAPSGVYNPQTRTITWFVGEVGPGQGGYAEFSINVRGDAPNGTEVINFATVYFPSVPEATRTNGIVSIVSLDITPPTTTASVSPAPNDAGWHNTNVTVTLTAQDEAGGTGVKEINYSLGGAQIGGSVVAGSNASVTISAEGTTSLTYFAKDNAENQEASKSLTIRIDKTSPAVTASRTPNPNASGWNNTDVTVHFEATDNLSGIQGDSFFDVFFTEEGANQSATHIFTDLAGNSASATASGINIDKISPVISGLPVPGCTLWPPNHRLVHPASTVVGTRLEQRPYYSIVTRARFLAYAYRIRSLTRRYGPWAEERCSGISTG